MAPGAARAARAAWGSTFLPPRGTHAPGTWDPLPIDTIHSYQALWDRNAMVERGSGHGRGHALRRMARQRARGQDESRLGPVFVHACRARWRTHCSGSSSSLEWKGVRPAASPASCFLEPASVVHVLGGSRSFERLPPGGLNEYLCCPAMRRPAGGAVGMSFATAPALCCGGSHPCHKSWLNSTRST